MSDREVKNLKESQAEGAGMAEDKDSSSSRKTKRDENEDAGEGEGEAGAAKKAKTSQRAESDEAGGEDKGTATAAEDGGEQEAEAEGEADAEASKKGRGRGGRGRGKGKAATASKAKPKAASTRGRGRGRGRGKAQEAETDEAREEVDLTKDKEVEQDKGEGEGEGKEQKEQEQPAGESAVSKDESARDEQASTSSSSKAPVGKGRVQHPHARETDQIIEKGKIYFWYRPKVERTEAHSAADVQRLYMLMAVHGEGKVEDDKFSVVRGSLDEEVSKTEAVKFRLVVIGSKRLPEATPRSRGYAFTEAVSDKVEEVTQALHKSVYQTATLGDRHLDACRCAGEAVYEIVMHNNNSHLLFAMELPHAEDFGTAQSAFGLSNHGNIVISIKNPTHPQADVSANRPGFAGVHDKPQFPHELQKFFKGVQVAERKWAPVASSQLLDFKHSELYLMGTSEGMDKEFPNLAAELEKEEEDDLAKVDKETQHHPEKSAYTELQLKDEKEVTEPLQTGKMV